MTGTQRIRIGRIAKKIGRLGTTTIITTPVNAKL